MLAVKVAEVAPAATLTEAGTVNAVEALLESATRCWGNGFREGDRASRARVGGQAGGGALQRGYSRQSRERERGGLGRAVEGSGNGGGLIRREGCGGGKKCSAAEPEGIVSEVGTVRLVELEPGRRFPRRSR